MSLKGNIYYIVCSDCKSFFKIHIIFFVQETNYIFIYYSYSYKYKYTIKIIFDFENHYFSHDVIENSLQFLFFIF